MKIKICGITTLNDALLCESEGADALGFVFYNKSKRYVTPDQAAKISMQLSPFTLRVGVFVNETPEEINKISRTANLQCVQIIADSYKDYQSNLFISMIPVFRVNEDTDYNEIEKQPYPLILLDTYKTNVFGGTGKSFRWDAIPTVLRNKTLVAGGINELNIEYIFRNITPYGIDSSSGLEQSPGKKDTEKVKRFFNKIRELRGY